jgi:hypothetical protein
VSRTLPTPVLLAAVLVAACGTDERGRVEAAVREREHLAAGPVASVACERAGEMWGCRLRLADGRTQACQVALNHEDEVEGVACQPVRGE